MPETEDRMKESEVATTGAYGHALVLGLGVSGEAAAQLLLTEGTSVTVVDANEDDPIDVRADALKQRGATVLTASSALPAGDFDVCIVSPGVPAHSDWVRQLEARGVPVLSELELGSRRCRCRCLAVTGTNGKSTLTKLCVDALNHARRQAAVAGNYGPPLCGLVPESASLDWVVAEVSSFQLERTEQFHPSVGVLLNVQPDHLDRHGDMQTYTRTKARLFENMTAGDTAIVPEELADDLSGWFSDSNAAGPAPDWVTFGETSTSNVWYDKGRIHLCGPAEEKTVDVSGTWFDNPVLGLTAAAAAAALRACGSDPAVLAAACRRFDPLAHRMTPVGETNGVVFIDDSKATNLSALAAALRMTDRPVRLIAGGLLKEGGLKSLQETLVKKVRALYVIGKAAIEMDTAWGDAVPCKPCGTLERAVREAWKDASPGEAILLSPGCASFDQFCNFEDRGNQFIKLARFINEET